MKKVIIITGASSGIGRATADLLVSEGHIVYGTGRKDKELAEAKKSGIRILKVEMTDDASMKKAVSKVVKEQGRIDVLFNNAGYGLYGAVEDVPLDAARHQFEVNLFSLARMTQLVLPYMRKAKSGLIINMSSMGGQIYLPMGAWYHASKHAVEGFSDSLRLDLKQFGINVSIIEPGAIATHFGDTMEGPMLKYSGKGPYKALAKAMAKSTDNTYGRPETISPPSVVAKTVSKAISSDKPKTRYKVGKYARPFIFARKYLGDRVFDKLALQQVRQAAK